MADLLAAQEQERKEIADLLAAQEQERKEIADLQAAKGQVRREIADLKAAQDKERARLTQRAADIEARMAARRSHESELSHVERITQHRNSLAFWKSLPRSNFAYCSDCASTSLYDGDENQDDPAGNLHCRNPFCPTKDYGTTDLGDALRAFERDNAGVAPRQLDVPSLVKIGIVIQDPTANNEVLMVESCSTISSSGLVVTRNAEAPLFWWTFPWTRVSEADLDKSQAFPAIQRLLMSMFGMNSDWMFVEGPNSWMPQDYAVCTPPGFTPTLFILVRVPGWKRIMEGMRTEWWEVRSNEMVAKYRNYRWFSASFPFDANAHFSPVGIQVIKELLKVPLRFIAQPLADHAQQLQYAPGLSQLEVYWLGSLLETCRKVDNNDFDTFHRLVVASALLVSKDRKHIEPRNTSVFSFKLLECGSQSTTDPLSPAYQRRIREAIILPTAARIEAGPLFGLCWKFGRLSLPSNLWIETFGRGPPSRNFLSHEDCSWAWRAPGLAPRRAPRSSIEFLKFEESSDSKFSFSVVMNHIYDVFQGRIREGDNRIPTSPVHSPESVSAPQDSVDPALNELTPVLTELKSAAEDLMTFDVATSSDIELAQHCRKLVRTIGREEGVRGFVEREVERQTQEHAYHQSNPLCALCGDRNHWARDCPQLPLAQRQSESRNPGEQPSGAPDPSQGPGRAKKKKKKKQTSQ